MKPQWYYKLSDRDKDLYDCGADFSFLPSLPETPFEPYEWLNYRKVPVKLQASHFDKAGSKAWVDQGKAVLCTATHFDTLSLVAAVKIMQRAYDVARVSPQFYDLGEPWVGNRIRKEVREGLTDAVVVYNAAPHVATRERLQLARDVMELRTVFRIMVSVGEPLAVCRSLGFQRFSAAFYFKDAVEVSEPDEKQPARHPQRTERVVRVVKRGER